MHLPYSNQQVRIDNQDVQLVYKKVAQSPYVSRFGGEGHPRKIIEAAINIDQNNAAMRLKAEQQRHQQTMMLMAAGNPANPSNGNNNVNGGMRAGPGVMQPGVGVGMQPMQPMQGSMQPGMQVQVQPMQPGMQVQPMMPMQPLPGQPQPMPPQQQQQQQMTYATPVRN